MFIGDSAMDQQCVALYHILGYNTLLSGNVDCHQAVKIGNQKIKSHP